MYSGASAPGLASAMALRFDRDGAAAEASRIAGAGGDVPSRGGTAKSGGSHVALDRCAPACVKHPPARHGVRGGTHFPLTGHTVSKRDRADVAPAAAERVLAAACSPVRERPATARTGFAASQTAARGEART